MAITISHEKVLLSLQKVKQIIVTMYIQLKVIDLYS